MSMSIDDGTPCPEAIDHNNFYLALVSCDSNTIEELVQKGIPVHHYSCSCFDKSPLMVAAGIAFFSKQREQEVNIDPVKHLLLHGADITETDFDGQYAHDWSNLSTHSKLLSIDPKNNSCYQENPKEYIKDHPDEFNPVKKFPHYFENERDWLKQWCLKKLIKKYSLVNYLKHRELGLAKS